MSENESIYAPLQLVKIIQKELLDMLNNNKGDENVFFNNVENSQKICALLEAILVLNRDSNLGLIGPGLYGWHPFYSITKSEDNYVRNNVGTCLRVLLLESFKQYKYIMYNFQNTIVYFEISMENDENISVNIQSIPPYHIEHLLDFHEE